MAFYNETDNIVGKKWQSCFRIWKNLTILQGFSSAEYLEFKIKKLGFFGLEFF